MRRSKRGSGIAVDHERIRRARLERGLTLAQIAQDDVSRSFIHQVEHGISRPSLGVLRMIAQRTGKPVSYFTASGTEPHPATAGLPAELHRLAKRLRTFSRTAALTDAERATTAAAVTAVGECARLVRLVSTRSA